MEYFTVVSYFQTNSHGRTGMFGDDVTCEIFSARVRMCYIIYVCKLLEKVYYNKMVVN